MTASLALAPLALDAVNVSSWTPSGSSTLTRGEVGAYKKKPAGST
jgi:hypothetical protein